MPRSSTSDNMSNGYNPKDLYDFGEYGGGDCAWGSRTELNSLITNYNSLGLNVVSDVVYNHRDGGKPEKNTAAKYYITTPGTASPYPSDRFFCIIPLGSSNPGNNGPSDYYIKIKSKTNGYNANQYKFYARTNATSGTGAQVNETEPNGGIGCGQPSNAYTMNQQVVANLYDYSGCYVDEFKVSLTAGNISGTDDTLFVYLTNYNSGYSDHYITGVWSDTRGQDIVNEVEYWTYTNFSGLPSGQGGGNYNDFRPTDATANAGGVSESLGCDWNCPLFFYDDDQSQPSVQNLLNAWTKWQLEPYGTGVGIKGLRMDAVKHFDYAYVSQLMNYLYNEGTIPQFVVGESFDFDAGTLVNWVNNVQNGMSSGAQDAIKVRAFDFALRAALKNACDQFGFDVRNVFNSGMVDGAGGSGFNAVTFINNHDFRGPGEPVQNDPMLAYAYILTNNQVGAPCVFYPDYYGVTVPNAPTVTLKNQINALVDVHQSYIYGSEEIDYLSRFSTPYYQYFLPGNGGASTTLVYQIKPPSMGSPTVIVAINFAGTPLDMYQGVNTSGPFGGVGPGTVFDDVIGNAGGGSTNITNNNEIHVQLPARSYTVYVQNLGPLPVELLRFDAMARGTQVALNWQTASERQAACFEVERAVETPDVFEKIETLPATNSSGGADYQALDVRPLFDVPLYYRLKMIDLDGSFRYSPVRSVQLYQALFHASLQPNPAKRSTNLRIKTMLEADVYISAVNGLGQVVWQKNYPLEKGEQLLPIDLRQWPDGLYQISLRVGTSVQMLRLVKE
ncbi:MAG: hypothetical protein IPL65_11645 [Lewinellaceae bacterium]|nr:hypothetical protein [Lewinellaceae bacterium]